MSIFKGLFHSRDKPRNRLGGFVFLFGGTSSGKTVNEHTAMQTTAVYACVRILSEAVAGLPLHVYLYKSDGGKERVPLHPLYRLLHDEPEPGNDQLRVQRDSSSTPSASRLSRSSFWNSVTINRDASR